MGAKYSLLPGDQLIKINGQDVRKAPREYVITRQGNGREGAKCSLSPSDQLIKINGEDVRTAPMEYVIDLVRWVILGNQTGEW